MKYKNIERLADYSPEYKILSALEEKFHELEFLSEYNIEYIQLYIVALKNRKPIVKSCLDHYELRKPELCIEKVSKEIEKVLYPPSPQPIQGKYTLLKCECCNAPMTNPAHCDYCGAIYALM